MKDPFTVLRLALSCAFLSISIGMYGQNKQDAGFVLKGNITGTAEHSKVILFDIDRQAVLDSAETVNGAFVLKGHVSRPTTCWIQCNNEYATIQVENTDMTFTSPLKDMKTSYTAQGGREQSLQNELDHLQRGYERIYLRAYDSLINKLYKDTMDKARLIRTFTTAQDTYMDIYVAFGREHFNSYLGLDIVYRNRKHIPKDSLALLYNSLPSSLKATDKAQALQTYLNEKLARKGEHFLDFEARTIQGQLFKLSNLKGKYIYLAFGSASCGPCRIENREIAKRYGTLSKKLEVVNFSLDVNRNDWETAAKTDGIVWYNVSDMMGMAGKIKTLYDVQVMPTSFLIGPNGLIVERFVGYSDQHIKEIEKIVLE